jgi:hypothetical protein
MGITTKSRSQDRLCYDQDHSKRPGWRVVKISPFCRIRQQTPGIRHHLPNFDLITELDQISEALCSVVLKTECMFFSAFTFLFKPYYTSISMQQLVQKHAQAFEQSDVISFCQSKLSMYFPAFVPEEGTSCTFSNALLFFEYQTSSEIH